MSFTVEFTVHTCCCCCCLPTHPCLFGGVLPYFEVTGHPVPVSALGFKCPDCLIWNCSYTAYPSKEQLHMLDVSDGGMGGRHS